MSSANVERLLAAGPKTSQPLQEQAEVLQWLEDEVGVSNKAFAELKADRARLHAMRVQPELATAKANVAALKAQLHMSDAQVRKSYGCCAAIRLLRDTSFIGT